MRVWSVLNVACILLKLLCVMSRAENANGLILASSPIFKKVFGKSNVSRSHDLPFDIHSRKFSLL